MLQKRKQKLKVVQFLSGRARIQIKIVMILSSVLFQFCIEERYLIVVIFGRWDHVFSSPTSLGVVVGGEKIRGKMDRTCCLIRYG